MTKVILYIATSKDNYIADENGGVDWLPQTVEETGGQDFGYQQFYDSVDAIAIGRKTYEQILGFGDWPYPGKLSYIFTHRAMQSPRDDVKFVHDDLPGFVQSLKDNNIKKLWLVGGSDLIAAFYAQNLIYEFIITVFPAVLKKGILLNALTDALQKNKLIELHSTNFDPDVQQLHYRIKD